jgi:hypothetical protein
MGFEPVTAATKIMNGRKTWGDGAAGFFCMILTY